MAWVAARAFAVVRRPQSLASVWAAGSALWLHTPVLLGLTMVGGVARSADRTATLAVARTRFSASALLAAVIWYALLITLIAVAPVAVSLSSAAFTLGPAVVDAIALLVRASKLDARAMTPLARDLRRRHETVWTVGTWAAWPPRTRAGQALVDELLAVVSADVRVLAVARNDRVAALLIARGFRPVGIGHLLLFGPALPADLQADLLREAARCRRPRWHVVVRLAPARVRSADRGNDASGQ